MSRTKTRSLQWPLGLVLLAMAFGPVSRAAQQAPQSAINLPLPVQRYIQNPSPFPARTTTVTPGTLQKVTLKVKVKGSQFPLSGQWIWTGTISGEGGKPESITLKVKVGGTKLTGNWNETAMRTYDGMGPISEISDGEVVNATTITFKRCKGTVTYITAYGDEFGIPSQHSISTFKRCERDRFGRLKSDQTVVEYTGKVSSNDLTLTIKVTPGNSH
jgi:hypothetical protein